MKLKKAISVALLYCLFINNISSFAGILSEDGRYETFEGNNVTIDNILEEDSIANIELEGNTLVNHVDYSAITTGNIGVSIDRDTREITFDNIISESDSSYTDMNLYIRPNLKSGETYTVAVNVLENTILGNQFFMILDSHQDYIPVNGARVPHGKKGIVKFKFTVKESNNGIFKIYLRNYKDQENRGIVKIKDLMILEGDWTNKEVPTYFEGMKSVGELENNQINIVSKNKNLLNLDIYKDANIANGGLIEVSSDSIKITTPKTTLDSIDCYMDIGVDAPSSWFFERDCKKYTIPIKPNTEYTLSYDVEVESVNNHDVYLDFRDVNYNKLKMYEYRRSVTGDTFTVTSPENSKYVLVRFDNNLGGNSLVFKNIQLEESNKKTTCNQYMENAKKINLREPLRCLPNGVKDRIIKKDGQWVVERNTKEVVLTGGENENWGYGNDNVNIDSNNTISIQRNFNDIAYGLDVGIQLVSNLFPSYEVANISNITEDKEWIRSYSSTSGNVGVRILKSKLTSPTLEGFREWLSNNNLKVVYQLKKPVYEPLNIDSSIKLYLDTTYISSSSNIPANIKITIDRIVNRAQEAIEIAKANPTIENISSARIWVNLMNESSLKDGLQNEIDSIIEIQDLTIEKKSVSVNSDIYIKIKNTLSLSLNTNSIVFDEIDVTEDLEMQNAVNLSVNSSLPYKVNTYLESELYNSDLSSKLDKSVLNIKSNVDTEYKAFTDVNVPIVLLDNQYAGMNNSHGVDIRINSADTYKADIYKATIKFEVEQK